MRPVPRISMLEIWLMICFYVVVLMLGNIEIREREGVLQPESEVKYFLLLRQATPKDSSVKRFATPTIRETSDPVLKPDSTTVHADCRDECLDQTNLAFSVSNLSRQIVNAFQKLKLGVGGGRGSET